MKWNDIKIGKYYWVEGDKHNKEPYVALCGDYLGKKAIYPPEMDHGVVVEGAEFYEVPSIEELERVRGIEILHNIRNGKVR